MTAARFTRAEHAMYTSSQQFLTAQATRDIRSPLVASSTQATSSATSAIAGTLAGPTCTSTSGASTPAATHDHGRCALATFTPPAQNAKRPAPPQPATTTPHEDTRKPLGQIRFPHNRSSSSFWQAALRRNDAAFIEPLQKLPIAVGGICRQCLRQVAVAFTISFDHGVRRCALVTQSCRGSLHAHDDATAVIDQIVVVIAQPCWTAFGCKRRIRIRGRNFVLLRNRRFDGVLLFQFGQILAHRAVHFGYLCQLLAGNAAVMIGVGLDETAVHRHVLALYQSGLLAAVDDLLKQLLKQIRFLESSMPVLGKRRVVWNLLIEAQSREPTPCQMHA